MAFKKQTLTQVKNWICWQLKVFCKGKFDFYIVKPTVLWEFEEILTKVALVTNGIGLRIINTVSQGIFTFATDNFEFWSFK